MTYIPRSLQLLSLSVLTMIVTLGCGNAGRQGKVIHHGPEEIRVTFDYPHESSGVFAIAQYLSALARIPITVEDGAPDDQSPWLAGNELLWPKLKDVTLKECLDALARKSGRFVWKYQEGTINIISKPLTRMKDYPLDRTIAYFAFEGGTEVDLLLKFAAIDERIVPFLVSTDEPEERLGQQIQFHARNKTMRQILNTHCALQGLRWDSTMFPDGEIYFSFEPLRYQTLQDADENKKSTAEEGPDWLLSVLVAVIIVQTGVIVYLLLRRKK